MHGDSPGKNDRREARSANSMFGGGLAIEEKEISLPLTQYPGNFNH
jgi:hypothetical protein